MSMTRLFVGGLSPDVTEKEVEGKLAPFGKVQAVELVRSEEGEQTNMFHI